MSKEPTADAIGALKSTQPVMPSGSEVSLEGMEMPEEKLSPAWQLASDLLSKDAGRKADAAALAQKQNRMPTKDMISDIRNVTKQYKLRYDEAEALKQKDKTGHMHHDDVVRSLECSLAGMQAWGKALFEACPNLVKISFTFSHNDEERVLRERARELFPGYEYSTAVSPQAVKQSTTTAGVQAR